MADSLEAVRDEPRLTINALAEYMSALSGQREAILRNQKYPKPIRIAYYREASAAIRHYLIMRTPDIEFIDGAIQRLRGLTVQKPTKKQEVYERQRINSNIEALKSFREMTTSIDLCGLTARRGPREGWLNIEGVRVSVRPDLILTGSVRGVDCVGAVKLYVQRGAALTDIGFSTVGSLVRQFLSADRQDDAACNAKHCFVLDVFAKVVKCAPVAVVRTRSHIDAACREIGARWPDL